MALHLTEAEASKILKTPSLRHKYGVAAPEDRTYNGVVYHSKAEARYAWQLDCRLHAGELSWQRQTPFDLHVNGVKIGLYRADFLVTHADGRREVVEIKGYWTPLAKRTWAHFRAEYAGLLEAGWTFTVIDARRLL